MWRTPGSAPEARSSGARRAPGSERAQFACAGRRVLGATLVAVLVACGALPATAADDRDTVPRQPLVEGEEVFAAKGCGHCHAISGGGEPHVGPDLGHARSWQDVMQLAGSLWNHTPAMLERMRADGVTRATLSADDMGKLSAYLLYLNFLDEPGSFERGRALFEARSCARCHQLDGNGGTTGPRLDELRPYASSLFLAQALWNHGPDMAAKMRELGIERPRLENDDVTNLVAFIRGADAAPLSARDVATQLGSPRAGKALFSDKTCVKCHAIAGVGGSVGPDLGTHRPMRHVGEMAGALWNHGPAMWAKMRALDVTFPRLDGAQTADVLAYLYFAQYMDERGDATRGAKIFREKSCAGCHAPATGGAVGPNLAASGLVRSSLGWASAMWNHAPVMAQKTRDEGIAWPQFANDEMRDLVAFLRTQSRAE